MSSDSHDIDALRAQLLEVRGRTRAAIADLDTEVREELGNLTDWRTWYEARPMLILGVAFAVGFHYGYRR